jgi:hypothetical protein
MNAIFHILGEWSLFVNNKYGPTVTIQGYQDLLRRKLRSLSTNNLSVPSVYPPMQ